MEYHMDKSGRQYFIDDDGDRVYGRKIEGDKVAGETFQGSKVVIGSVSHYVPVVTEPTTDEDMDARITELEGLLDTIRSKLCVCGSHHIDPEEHILYCPYRRAADE